MRMALVSDDLPLVSSQPFGPPLLAGLEGTSASDGRISLSGVQPGRYHFAVTPILNLFDGPPYLPLTVPLALRDYYVKSIRLGAADVLNGGLTIGGRPEGAFEIVLASHAGVLQGFVRTADGRPAGNATVLVAPEGRTRPDLYKRAISDRGGRYAVRGITPGDYLVYVWDQVEDGIWFDPDFLRQSRARASAVHLSEGANPDLNLTVRP